MAAMACLCVFVNRAMAVRDWLSVALGPQMCVLLQVASVTQLDRHLCQARHHIGVTNVEDLTP
jgi:hypothetical protein